MEPIHLKFHLTAQQAVKAGLDQMGDYALAVFPSQLDADQRDVLECLLGEQPIQQQRAFTSSRTSAHGERACGSVPSVLPIDAGEVPAWLNLIVRDLDLRLKDLDEAWDTSKARWVASLQEAMQAQVSNDRSLSDLEQALRRLNASPDRGGMRAEVEREQPELIAAVRVRQEEISGHIQEKRAAEERVRKELRELSRTRSERRNAQILEWMQQNGSEAHKKLHARGLLPEEDILGMIRDQVFAPLDDLEVFRSLTPEEIRRGLSLDPGDDVDTCERDATSGSEEDLALLERIEAAMPGVRAVLREQAGYARAADNEEDPEVNRYFVEVSVARRELELVRRYKAG